MKWKTVKSKHSWCLEFGAILHQRFNPMIQHCTSAPHSLRNPNIPQPTGLCPYFCTLVDVFSSSIIRRKRTGFLIDAIISRYTAYCWRFVVWFSLIWVSVIIEDEGRIPADSMSVLANVVFKLLVHRPLGLFGTVALFIGHLSVIETVLSGLHMITLHSLTPAQNTLSAPTSSFVILLAFRWLSLIQIWR